MCFRSLPYLAVPGYACQGGRCNRSTWITRSEKGAFCHLMSFPSRLLTQVLMQMERLGKEALMMTEGVDM